MRITVLGVSHRTAPIEIRERLAWSDGEVPDVAARALDAGAAGAVVLSTCNRIEIYLANADDRAVGRVWELAGARLGAPVPAHGYEHHGRDAVRHLFRVAAGLDSMILGESQIQGQVRRAWELNRRRAGPVLSRLFQLALRVGGQVRARTTLGAGAASVPSASVELAKKIFGPLDGRQALVLGAGEMAELALACLAGEGVRTAVVAHRNQARAAELAGRLGGEAIGFETAWPRFAEVDLVVCSTAAPHLVVKPDAIAGYVARREGRPVCILDIAVPRDVDPAVGELDSVFLYDIDDLEGVVATTLGARRREIPEAERIVGREVDFFWAWFRGRDVAATIRALRERMEAIRQTEVERVIRKLGHLPPEDRERIEHLSRALMNKFLHEPSVRLRGSAGNGADGQVADALHFLFDLDVRPAEGEGDDTA